MKTSKSRLGSDARSEITGKGWHAQTSPAIWPANVDHDPTPGTDWPPKIGAASDAPKQNSPGRHLQNMSSLHTRVIFLENRTDMNERLIEQAREEYREGRARIEGEISELRNEMRAEFSNMRADSASMRSEMSELRSEILNMSAEMRRSTRWIIGVTFGAVASLSILLPVVWQLAERWL